MRVSIEKSTGIEDEIDAIVKHHLNGAEREDLTDKQLQWLNTSIDTTVKELVKLFKVRGAL